MVVDKIHEKQQIGKGNTPSIVAIDKGGSLLLGVSHKRRIAHHITNFKGNEYIERRLPSNYRHIHGVNKLEVETILLCERMGYFLSEWKHEHYNVKSFMYNNEKVVLIPDVFVIMYVNEKPFVAFIEFDTGSESIRYKEPPIIRDKIIKYRRYKSSNLWLGEDWQKQFEQPIFPLVLFVTEDSNRIEFFNKKCKENNVKGLGIYHQNYTNVLEKIATLVK